MVWFFLYCWLDIRIRNKRFIMKMDKAMQIADMYALTIIGELHELSYTLPEQKETIH